MPRKIPYFCKVTNYNIDSDIYFVSYTVLKIISILGTLHSVITILFLCEGKLYNHIFQFKCFVKIL